MHRLDVYINDIVPRIKAICKYSVKLEEPSLQESLVSYGWIMLDSYIAWRTLRFLLRDSYIDEAVQEKWFKTPSSYTASQLKAIWNFSEDSLSYIERELGRSLKNIIDREIQEKRNACAHYSYNRTVNGMDSQRIKKLYDILSKVFMMYEFYAFLKRVCEKIKNVNINMINVSLLGNDDIILFECYLDDFINNTINFAKTKKVILSYTTNEDKVLHKIEFSEEGCSVFNKGKYEAIYKKNENGILKKYEFFRNKGYYREIDKFVDSLDEYWN